MWPTPSPVWHKPHHLHLHISVPRRTSPPLAAVLARRVNRGKGALQVPGPFRPLQTASIAVAGRLSQSGDILIPSGGGDPDAGCHHHGGHFVGRFSPPGSCQFQVAHQRCHPQSGPPRHQGKQAINHQPFFLALPGIPGCHLVPGLPAVPAGDGDETAGGGTPCHRQSGPALQPPTHRPGETPSPVAQPLHPPPTRGSLTSLFGRFRLDGPPSLGDARAQDKNLNLLSLYTDSSVRYFFSSGFSQQSTPFGPLFTLLIFFRILF
jgi:hypothetical protein